MKRFLLSLFAAAVLTVVACSISPAQDTSVVQVVQTEQGFFADFPVQEAVNAMVTLLTMFLSWLIVKKLLPMIPNWTIPILAGTVFPWLSNWLIGLAADTTLIWWQQSIYGMFAVVLHQLMKQMKEGAQQIKAKA